jgi:hypothetical protein
MYEYMDSFARFEETKLPDRESFYSNLSEEGISDREYERACSMWEKFQCRTLKDYHDLYLKMDVLLLADCFEEFRRMGMQTYGLDPSWYMTAPGYSWDCCLKISEVQLELITDPEIYLMIEKGIRGGISSINHRYARVNNPYLPPGQYDPTKDKSYLMYLDANSLYGWAMSQSLPTGGFKFLSEEEIEGVNFKDVADDSDTGYILEVDLRYPEKLHSSHNDYPLCPERMSVSKDMLSSYSKSFNRKHIDMEKLVPNLNDKKKYVIHYRNLKQYLSLGMELIKIHRVLTFQQSPFMKKYIDLNTRLRQLAKTEFGKAFFKLMINSVFGKTMENVRERMKCKLICDEIKSQKEMAKPNLKSFKIINEDLVLFSCGQKEILLNKPIYCGFTILENSKVLMYDFHYSIFKPRYGESLKLCFTDTDSLCYYIKTDDLYRDMLEFKDLLDTSNYPRDHFLYSPDNAKVYGKFKDETAGVAPLEFVGLKSKNYSLLVKNDEPSKKTAKGIKKSYVQKHVKHEHYLSTIRNKTITRARFQTINSFNHTIKTIINDKICLSAYDDKRYILDDGITTLAHGHCKLRRSSHFS